MYQVGIIGMGHMGAAIADGILTSKLYPAQQLLLCGRHIETMEPFLAHGAVRAADEIEVVTQCKFIILAVKPQNFTELLPLLKPHRQPHQVFVSVAAGISAAFLKNALGEDTKVILTMPNTPLQLGFGTTALARVEPTTIEEFNEAMRMFSANGCAEEIPEHLMNEVIALNGSSPAFLYRIAQIFVDHAVEDGFAYETALNLFSGAMIGAAHMMLASGCDLDGLIRAVCSKGGTTIAGLGAMQENELPKALIAGIDACTKRAYELGQ